MKRAFTLLELLAVVAIAAILAAVLYSVVQHPHDSSPRSYCQGNLKNISLGIKQYIQDYDEQYPTVISGGGVHGWADAIQPYIKSTQIYQCPSETTTPQSTTTPRSINYTDYWLNARIAGSEEKTFAGRVGIADNPSTLLLGDGHDGADATDALYALNSIPTEWIGNKSSPLYRHLEGANYAFADGHVKWYKADKMEALDPNAPPKSTNLTFALK